MMIPDRMLPLVLARSAAELGRVLLDLAVDMEAATDGDVAGAVRDGMSPTGRPPRILRETLADSIGQNDDAARALCYWDGSIGMELVLRWNEGSDATSAWIVVSGEHVLFTRDVSALPFERMDVRGGTAYPRS